APGTHRSRASNRLAKADVVYLWPSYFSSLLVLLSHKIRGFGLGNDVLA
ncbi:hypothetical protein SAMN05216228_11511, partial [Rhizobium tibeticum]